MRTDGYNRSTISLLPPSALDRPLPAAGPTAREEDHHFPSKRRRPRDGPAPTSGSPGATRPRWVVELAILAALYVAYDTTRGLRHGNLVAADRNGQRILRWEQWLHLSPEHALNQLLWHVPALAVPASYYYASLHFIVTPAVLVWMYRRHPDRYRYARRVLVVGTVVALVVYWLLPTTPPRLLPGGAFHDTLASVHQWGWWSNEGSAPRGLGNLTNQLAAMPSLHVGWALWSGVLIARYARPRWARILGGLYPIGTALVVMATGNHYLLDAVGGAAVMAVGVGVARLAGTRRPAAVAAPAEDRVAARPRPTVPIGRGPQPSSCSTRRDRTRTCRPRRRSTPATNRP